MTQPSLIAENVEKVYGGEAVKQTNLSASLIAENVEKVYD
jgi:hypothetical protein